MTTLAKLAIRQRGMFRKRARTPQYETVHEDLRSAKKRKNPERDFQIKLVRDLRRILPSDVFLTAFPAGGGGKIRGAMLKAMGLIPGVPDLMLIREGRVYFMELKAKRRRMSSSQVDCRLTLRHVGAAVEVVTTLDEALTALRVWQIPTRIAPLSITETGKG